MAYPPVTRSFALAFGVAALTLSACGGSDDDGDVAGDEPVVETTVESGGGDEPAADTTDGGGEGGSEPGDAGGGGEPAVVDDPFAGAPALTATTSFPVERVDEIGGVAVSPDGTRVAIRAQTPGTPAAITVYDSTGASVATTEIDVPSLGNHHWLADGRIVALDTSGGEPGWITLDGDTLDPVGATLPWDPTCSVFDVDKVAGAAFGIDGSTGSEDLVCRIDLTTGEVSRTADGQLPEIQNLWVRSGSGEVAVEHFPDPDDPSARLVRLDTTSLAEVSSTVVGPDDGVNHVGATVWIFNRDGDRLEPGAIPVPPLSPVESSVAGTVFHYSNGPQDVLFISAVDGAVIGTMPAGFNLSGFSDWSLDDSVMARLTSDGQIELYAF